MIRRLAGASILPLCVASVSAGVGAWQAQVLTQDGDDVVEPGETATIHLSVNLFPDPGEIDPDTGAETLGFGASFADFIALDAWSSGGVTWRINYEQLYGSQEPTLDQASHSVLGLLSSQSYFAGFSPDDPMWLIDLVWDPLGDYTPRRAGIRADARELPGYIPDDALWVYEGGIYHGGPVNWPLAPSEFSFQVVPAPAGAALIPLGALAAARRRR